MYSDVDTHVAVDAAKFEPGGALSQSTDFDAFFTGEYSRLVRLAWVLTGRRDLAEEHVQEAFLSAHRHWARVSQLDDPRSWIRRVVTNRCLSTARRRAVELRLLVRLRARPAVHAETAEPAEEVWAAVRRLPKRQSQVIALVYAEDLAIAEVAAILECTEPTARTHLRRGRAALAEMLGVPTEVEGDEPDGITG